MCPERTHAHWSTHATRKGDSERPPRPPGCANSRAYLVPISSTRSAGMLKKEVAPAALRGMATHSQRGAPLGAPPEGGIGHHGHLISCTSTPRRALSHTGIAGAGLGLPICKGIVEAHAGSIHAEHRETGGAVFRVTLPLVGVAPPLPTAEVVAPVHGSMLRPLTSVSACRSRARDPRGY
jgi:hypothetical protein